MNSELIRLAKKAADAWRDTDTYHQAADLIDALIKEQTDMPDWMQEFMFDPESAKRIVDTIYHHAMSLKDCAQLIEMAAPFYDRMTSDGVVAAIRDMTEQVQDINTMLNADIMMDRKGRA